MRSKTVRGCSANRTKIYKDYDKAVVAVLTGWDWGEYCFMSPKKLIELCEAGLQIGRELLEAEGKAKS